MNNFYGWVRSKYPAYARFNWLENADNFNVNSIIKRANTGHILEVDILYLDELHVLHNNYSLAPEKLAIPYEMLSDYCKKNC